MTSSTSAAVEPADEGQAATPHEFQVHEPCGTFLDPTATHCPVCAGQCGGPCCAGGTW